MPYEVPKQATLDEGDGGYAGLCECGYRTSGWPTAALAAERIGQHRAEHESWVENQYDPEKWVTMEPLEEFRAKHGLVTDEVNPNLAVFPEGAKEIKPQKKAASKDKE